MPPLSRELLQRRLQRCPMNIANEATLRARLPGGIALGFVILVVLATLTWFASLGER